MKRFAGFLTGFPKIAARIVVALPVMTVPAAAPATIAPAMIALTALSLSIPPLVPALADQKDSRLTPLFDALQKAGSPEEAQTIEAIIWSIWAQTGDHALDLLLLEGSLAMANDDYDTAMRDFNEVVKRAPNFAEGWNKRATLYFLMGNYMASLSDIDKTLALEPRHFGALAGLGIINLQLDRDQAALDAFQRVLKIDPMNAAARTNAEIVKHRLGDESI